MVLAIAAPPQIAAFGSGASTCPVALEPGRYETSYAWVMGYFTGLNSASQGQTGRTTDGDGIMAEVELLCRREPSLLLIDAAERVYATLRERPM